MGFRPSDSLMAWLGPLVIIAVGAIVILGEPQTWASLCTGAKDEQCLREWISALSGWAAAGAAALTIGVLITQVKVQQAQTDFQLGDARPTIDAVQHAGRSKRVIIRIRNWNRRSMLVRRISVICDAVPIHSISVTYDDKSAFSLLGPILNFDPAKMVEGWVNRSNEPQMLKLGILASLGNDQYLDENWSLAAIEVHYELVGMAGKTIEKVQVHMTSAQPDEDPAIILADDAFNLG